MLSGGKSGKNMKKKMDRGSEPQTVSHSFRWIRPPGRHSCRCTVLQGDPAPCKIFFKCIRQTGDIPDLWWYNRFNIGVPADAAPVGVDAGGAGPDKCEVRTV